MDRLLDYSTTRTAPSTTRPHTSRSPAIAGRPMLNLLSKMADRIARSFIILMVIPALWVWVSLPVRGLAQ